ncbi:MAG: hypothetical protein IJK44_03365 [Bacteroidales bacterium]|nr:hypothetical protein [Bacteroidales bacterium]
MKKIITILLILMSFTDVISAQTVKDSGYRTVAYIKSDGTMQDSSYRTIGYIKSDGRVQDASYRTIGYAKGIPLKWAAFYFFFL